MKKLIVITTILTQSICMIGAGTLTNVSNIEITVVQYRNYVPSANGKTAKGQIRSQAYIIPKGQNIDLDKDATSIDVFFSDQQPGIHASINPTGSYTITPNSGPWIITQD